MSDSHQHDSHHEHPNDGLVHAHVHPMSLYFKVFGALIFLTVLTFALALVHLGPWNFFVAVLIAMMKAALVALFFMHLKEDARFNGILFVGSLVFMGVFFVYTMNDTNHRGEWDEAYGTKVLPSTGEVAPGGGLHDPVVVKDHEGHGGGHEAGGHEGEKH